MHHTTKVLLVSTILATCAGTLLGTFLTTHYLDSHADYTMSEAQAIAYCKAPNHVEEDDFTIAYSQIGDPKPFIVIQALRDGTSNISFHSNTKQEAQAFITGAVLFNN